MNLRSMRTGILIALLVVTVASMAFAGPVNCALTPSDPACAPALSLSYQPSGGGPITFVPGGTPSFSNGSWLSSFTPQNFPGAFLFTGGQQVAAPDPFVGFSFGVINNSTGNLTFNYDFTTPFAGGPYDLASTIFADVLIDSAFQGTSTVTPVGDKFIMESYVNGVLIPGFGRGSGCTTVSFVCQSGFNGGIGPVPYLSAASGTLEVKGSFMLTPGSQYTLTGRTDLLQSVPEPGTLALLGTGVVGLAGLLRRRVL